jgi:hypothetical protein
MNMFAIFDKVKPEIENIRGLNYKSLIGLANHSFFHTCYIALVLRKVGVL